MKRRDAIGRMATLLAIGLLPERRAVALLPKPFEHPDPRPGITAEHVLSDDEIPRKSSVRTAYGWVRRFPEICDGIYCVCDCKSMGHRSLLACYEGKQPEGCGACREVAVLVGTMASNGKTLAEIRTAVDEKFG